MCTRCSWALKSDLLKQYHDTEWGVNKSSDQQLFECLVLEMMQSGLSWETVLNKRSNFRKAFAHFDVSRVATFSEKEVQVLLNDSGIIRHRGKIEAVVKNARCIEQIQKEYGSFSAFIWGYVEEPIVNEWEVEQDIPSQSELSQTISKDLKKKGFRFVGPTTVYSFMQAIGMVDDHIQSCVRKQAKRV